MFQNINESTINIESNKKEKKKINLFSNVFSITYLPIYVISFMISMVGLGGEVSPFSISILGACLSGSTPILGIVITGLLGNMIHAGVGGALGYLLMALVMVASIFILRPKYLEEEKNEKIGLAKNLFFASLIVQIARIGMAGFTIYDILSSISFAIIAVVFYKIFVNSFNVLQDFRERRAFSIEEVLGASLMLAISVSAFGELSVLGLSIRNILSILIVLTLGWKNGVLVGTTSGVTIGVTLGVITSSDPMMVAAYAISGMIAGILNRFGKLGVIIGFCLGNVVLAYVSNGYTVELIHFKEILVASIGLLAIPRTITINIEEFMGNSKMLPPFPDRVLNRSKETAEQLNNVSQTIQEMAKNYQQENKEFYYEEGKEKNKQIFITELLNNLDGYENNMLYDDMVNVEGKIVGNIFNMLLEKQEITREDLLSIFAKCNSFIIGLEDKQVSQYLEDNITQMVRIINMAYKISKSNFVWMKKMEENKKTIGTQLSGVSKAISNLAQNIQNEMKNEEEFLKEKRKIIELLKLKDIVIEEISIQRPDRYLIEIYIAEGVEISTSVIEKVLTDSLQESIVFQEEASIGNRLKFLSEDRYIMAFGNSETIKSKSEVSGDSILNIRLKDGKYLIAISDGMGSGSKAKQASTQALKMLENLLLSGFDKNTSIELINTSLMNQNEEIFATLDIAIIDLYQGNIEFIKSGACPTYIKNKNKVQLIQANSLPAGILREEQLQVFDRDITKGDILVMCSDGILDSNVEYKNKELWVRYLLEDLETTNTKKIADLILNESLDNNFGVAKDDMSVLVCKFLEKE